MTPQQKHAERNRRYYIKKFGARPSDLGAHIYKDPSVPALIAGSGLALPKLQYYAYTDAGGWKTGPADRSPSMRISATMTFGFVYSIVTKYCGGLPDTVWFCTSPGVIGGPCREHPSPHELVLPSLPAAMSGKVSWLCQQTRTDQLGESPPLHPDPHLESAPLPQSEAIPGIDSERESARVRVSDAGSDSECESATSECERAPEPIPKSDTDSDVESQSSGCHTPEAKRPRASTPPLSVPSPSPDLTPDLLPLCCDACKDASEDCDIFRTTQFKQCCTPCLLTTRPCRVQGKDVEQEGASHIVPSIDSSCLVVPSFPAALPPSYEIPRDKISTQKFRSRDVRGIVRAVGGKKGAEYILALTDDQPDEPAAFRFVQAASQTRRALIPIELREQFLEKKDVVFLSSTTARGSLEAKKVTVDQRRTRCEVKEAQWPMGVAYGCKLAACPSLHPSKKDKKSSKASVAGDLVQARTCPAGHALVASTETARGGRCDQCDAAVAQGSTVIECAPCDWYMCLTCSKRKSLSSPFGGQDAQTL